MQKEKKKKKLVLLILRDPSIFNFLKSNLEFDLEN